MFAFSDSFRATLTVQPAFAELRAIVASWKVTLLVTVKNQQIEHATSTAIN
jgi:uncharacterized protein YeaO (DUF488 family)